MSDETSLEGIADSEECFGENTSHDAKERSGKPAAEEKSEKTLDGAVAIIYYDTPDDEPEFYFEEKPANYAIERFRGKLSFVGGGIETKDKDSLEALVRELEEEVESKEAQGILIAELRRTRNLYEVVEEYVNGKTAKTYVYIIRIDSPKQWNIVKASPLTDDAGPKRVLTLRELLHKGEDDFAFSMGGVIARFVKDFYPDVRKKADCKKSLQPCTSYSVEAYAPGSFLAPLKPLEVVCEPYNSGNLRPGEIILFSPCIHAQKNRFPYEKYPVRYAA